MENYDFLKEPVAGFVREYILTSSHFKYGIGPPAPGCVFFDEEKNGAFKCRLPTNPASWVLGRVLPNPNQDEEGFVVSLEKIKLKEGEISINPEQTRILPLSHLNIEEATEELPKCG